MPYSDDEHIVDAVIVGEEHIPVYRESYPIIVPVAVGCVIATFLLIVGFAYVSFKPYVVYALAIAIGAVIYWWRDTLRTLRSRIPPDGWKSEVQPEELMDLAPEEFDAMRFALAGKNSEDLSLHEVPWVTRYSRSLLYEGRSFFGLACLCVVGALLWPYVTLPGGNGRLPEQYAISWLWLVVAAAFLVAAWERYSDWRYGRLMVDQGFFYDLKLYPAWMPWVRGRYEPYNLKFLYRADADDVRFGRRWNHGTLVLSFLDGPFAVKSKRFKRVPRHLEFSVVINGLNQ